MKEETIKQILDEVTPEERERIALPMKYAALLEDFDKLKEENAQGILKYEALQANYDLSEERFQKLKDENFNKYDKLMGAYVLLVDKNASEMINEQQMDFDDVQAWKQLQYKRAGLTINEKGE